MKKPVIFLTTLFISLAMLLSCQNSDYVITGTTNGLENGDTLILTTDLNANTPLQKVVVNDGMFELKGHIDSVALCVLYVANQPDVNISFFLEPAEIKVSLSTAAKECKVSGTEANEAWQLLNEKTAQYNEKMQKTIQAVYQPGGSSDIPEEVMLQLQSLEKEMIEHILQTAEQNIGNEMGYFVVTHFEDDNYFTASRRMSLIEKMPAQFKERIAIKRLVETLKSAKNSDKGAHIEDFFLPDLDGKETSVMSIIRENKLTVIDFWASWCGPCRQEMPNMVDLYKEFQSKGLAIIGISLDEDKERWEQAVKAMNMQWPQLSDLRGWQSSAAQLFQIKAIPQTIIVDQQGVIVEKGLRGQQLKQFVAERL